MKSLTTNQHEEQDSGFPDPIDEECCCFHVGIRKRFEDETVSIMIMKDLLWPYWESHLCFCLFIYLYIFIAPQRRYNEDLPLPQSGFVSVTEMISAMSDTFHLKPGENDSGQNWIVMDIQDRDMIQSGVSVHQSLSVVS